MQLRFTTVFLLVSILFCRTAAGKGCSVPAKEELPRFETRASCQVAQDEVSFDFSLYNHHYESQNLIFGSGQQFELTITDENGEEVWRYSDGKFFTLALVMKTIDPGGKLNWKTSWDLTDKKGEKVSGGKYKAQIWVLARCKGSRQVEEQFSAELSFTVPIRPAVAEEIISETAEEVLCALRNKDLASFIEHVHPLKGVRFTPYTYVSLADDLVLNKEELSTFFADQAIYSWGDYDGTGEPILLTKAEYYQQFVYPVDYLHAPQIGYNQVLSFGNMLENQFQVYDNPIVVEYYFPGFEPQYEGMDWRSLRLVFEAYEDSWKLVGIISNQWTI